MSNHLRRLEVDGFRGFEHLVLTDLGDVNVIVGKNNVGKTALFESLVLLGQPCHIDNSVVLNQTRGLAELASDTAETWALHFNQRLDDPIVRIVGVGNRKDRRTLTIRMGQGADLYQERHERKGNALEPRMNAILQQKAVRFDYTRADGESAWAIAAVVAGQLAVIDSSSLPNSVMSCYASTWRLAANAPQFYSDVVKAGQEDAFLAGLRSIAPDIRRLTLLTRAGVPTLHASLEDGPLLPVQMLGDGVARVASWLLILLHSRDSWLLIDEIENGIHHSVLTDVWRVLLKTAKERNVQLFATTHSYEVLEALNKAHHSLSDNAPTLRVIRLQRVKGEIKAVTYTEEVLDAAVTSDVEVR